jgi:hypothetical protein
VKALRSIAVLTAWVVTILAWDMPHAGAETAAKATPRFSSSSAKSFVDITDQAGVRHRHQKPMLDEKLNPIMPWMASVGASAAAADYDGDGDIDLYVTNSRLGQPNRLFRNKGDGTFVDVAERAGVAHANAEHGTSMDAVWGDYDNDGHLDLYVAKWGWNILYHADGDGTFTDVTEQSATSICGTWKTRGRCTRTSRRRATPVPTCCTTTTGTGRLPAWPRSWDWTTPVGRSTSAWRTTTTTGTRTWCWPTISARTGSIAPTPTAPSPT